MARSKLHRRRRATVYDATAGRVSTYGFMNQKMNPMNQSRLNATTSTVPLTADEVLFRNREGSDVEEEEEEYFNPLNRLGPNDLPSSDLLRAIHVFTSFSYGEKYGVGRNKESACWSSMDGTALIAIGVLMEELAREKIGKNGDLGLVDLEENGCDDEPGVAVGGDAGEDGDGDEDEDEDEDEGEDEDEYMDDYASPTRKRGRNSRGD